MSLISGIDHVVIGVRDLAGGVVAYETLLARAAAPGDSDDGVATALISTENLTVELMAPAGEGATANRLRAALAHGEGLMSLVFATPDIERLHRRCVRVGLEPEPIKFAPPAPGAPLRRSFRAGAERTHGVRLFFMQRAAPLPIAPLQGAGALALDHVVVRSGAGERAAALYGARLGLDMRLDRVAAGRRLLFFRCGDVVVEIVCEAEMAGGPDQLWGLSWRVRDADAARARLAAAGVDVSDVRAGLKPGTRVFSVRDGTCGVPTLMLEASQDRD